MQEERCRTHKRRDGFKKNAGKEGWEIERSKKRKCIKWELQERKGAEKEEYSRGQNYRARQNYCSVFLMLLVV